MKIELANLKHSPSLSEETPAYTATILIDGKPAFAASNHGHGGGDFFRPLPGYDGPCEHDVSLWLRNNTPPIDADGIELECDLELYCHMEIERRERRRALDRLMTKKVVFIGEHQGQPCLKYLAPKPARKVGEADIAMVAKRIAEGKMAGEIVNGNPAAYERALALI